MPYREAIIHCLRAAREKPLTLTKDGRYSNGQPGNIFLGITVSDCIGDGLLRREGERGPGSRYRITDAGQRVLEEQDT